MSLKAKLADRLENTKVAKRLVTDLRYRTVFFAGVGLLFNLLYALYNGVLGIIGTSLWFITMCAYYTVLGTMRFFAVLCERKSGSGASLDTEYLVMKISGALLIVLIFVLSGVIYISISQNIAMKYGEIIMITIAAYTFLKIGAASAKAVKQRKNPSPLLAVIGNIGYAEVAASVLTLQRSMLVSFGEMSTEKIRVMNMLTGAAACLFILALGISMIVKVRKKVKTMAKSKLVEANEKIARKVTDTFGKIEDAAIGGYSKIENSVVGSYSKIEDAFVERYLAKDGETVEEAKKRLKNENPV